MQDVIDKREVEEEERNYQMSARGRAMMFQNIDDVQLQTYDPYYDEIDTEGATSHRERQTHGPFGGTNPGQSAQDGIF